MIVVYFNENETLVTTQENERELLTAYFAEDTGRSSSDYDRIEGTEIVLDTRLRVFRHS